MSETITVFGCARRRVAPDLGVWQAVVEARGADERQAYTACAAALRTVHAAVDGAADTADVSVGGIWVQPEWSDSGQRRIGSLATAQVAIRDSVANLEALGQCALEAGAVRLDGPTYVVGNALAIMDELGAEAVAAAHVRASALAAAAGRSVGQVVRIVDGIQEHDVGWSSKEMIGTSARMMASGPVSPEVQELQADVTVTYLLA